MATVSGTPERTRLRTPVLRRSWNILCGSPAATSAVRHARLKSPITRPAPWKTCSATTRSPWHGAVRGGGGGPRRSALLDVAGDRDRGALGGLPRAEVLADVLRVADRLVRALEPAELDVALPGVEPFGDRRALRRGGRERAQALRIRRQHGELCVGNGGR